MFLTASTPLLAPVITELPMSVMVLQAFKLSTNMAAQHTLKRIVKFMVFCPIETMGDIALARFAARLRVLHKATASGHTRPYYIGKHLL